MDNATRFEFQRIMRASRGCMGAEAKRADPGAFTAYCLLVMQTAGQAIADAGYVGVEMECDWVHGELIAVVHGTPAVAVGL